MLNIQSSASNIPTFNTAQGPSIGDIQKVEVQKDSSTPQVPNAETRKGPAKAGEAGTEGADDEGDKRRA
jgi:hypothetical protein